MTYLKCAIVGIVAGVGTAVLWMMLRLFLAFHAIASSGSGGLGTVSAGLGEMFLPGIAGFAIGFFLMLRRGRARTARRA